MHRWLLAQGRDADLAEHVLQQQRYLAVIELLRRTSGELRLIYASQAGPDRMRERKQAAFARLRDEYGRLKAQWHGRGPFDTWFQGDLNNAHLASIATYYDCVPGFERELAAARGDLRAFYRRVRDLAKQDPATRDAALCVGAAARAPAARRPVASQPEETAQLSNQGAPAVDFAAW